MTFLACMAIYALAAVVLLTVVLVWIVRDDTRPRPEPHEQEEWVDG